MVVGLGLGLVLLVLSVLWGCCWLAARENSEEQRRYLLRNLIVFDGVGVGDVVNKSSRRILKKERKKNKQKEIKK